ncbi:MAG: copper resistance protein CopC [Kineosporiaceae bacterium]|nr:copper resistance protein CopC [Kineosporiaceae bacterium]MBK7621308.1 copper resistance protein CopC [Kineosporiaceae bacterium]MBK8077537.1 copper resistance protein CopC [Kineosporiaceae bacterium]
MFAVPSHPPVGSWTRLGRVVAVLVVTLSALLGWGLASAQAHSGVRSIEPADGSVLSVPPPEIKMTFTENVLKGTAQLRLTGPAGATALTVTTNGPVISSPMPDGATSGEYTVLWRVTSADGHPISGKFGFTVIGQNVAASTPAAASATPSVVAPSPAASSVPAATTQPAPVESAVGGNSTTKIIVSVAAVLAMMAGIGAMVARSRRSQP